MIENKKIVVIIPARSGSKGLVNKNIMDLDGKPLLSWPIESALKSKYVDRTGAGFEASARGRPHEEDRPPWNTRCGRPGTP